MIVEKLDSLHTVAPALTVDDLATLTVPTMVILGDDDKVQLEHAVAMYRALPDGELAVLPRATHGLVVEKPALFAQLIRDFHHAERINGLAPIRRARTSPQAERSAGRTSTRLLAAAR